MEPETHDKAKSQSEGSRHRFSRFLKPIKKAFTSRSGSPQPSLNQLVGGPVKELADGKKTEDIVNSATLESASDNSSKTPLSEDLTVIQVVSPPKEILDVKNAQNEEATVASAVQEAKEVAAQMRPIATINQREENDSNITVQAIIRKLDEFSSIVSDIADVHPYSKMACKILFFATSSITKQMDLDDELRGLVEFLDRFYAFVDEAEKVKDILPQRDILRKLSLKTVDLAHFIVSYSKNKSFWVRLGKNLFTEASGRMSSYKVEFDDIMKEFHDHSALHTQANTVRILGSIEHLRDHIDLNDLEYARGATGYDKSKQCLPNTRVDLLDEIANWVNNQSDDVPQVFWLSGGAGTGKSTIAHTTARRFSELGRLGCCFSFDKTASGDRRYAKVFSTIARDLADVHVEIYEALATIVHNSPTSVKSTSDVTQQWETLILEAVNKLFGDEQRIPTALIGPILIVIDALDESGDDLRTRSALLSILGGGSSSIGKLPKNFRFLITSRPLKDIIEPLRKDPSYVYIKSMEEVPDSSTIADLSTYIYSRLSPVLGDFLSSQRLRQIVDRSDQLFQWAYLACEYIVGHEFGGLTEVERFEELCIAHSSAESSGDVLLHDLYFKILSRLFDLRKPAVRARFQSVMGQVLGTIEPLPRDSLNAMRAHFPRLSKNDKDISAIVDCMGSLLSGTLDSSKPIRPIHASFYEFLTDKKASGEFYVDIASIQHSLAASSMQIMLGKDGLRFNIAGLESSYLTNAELLNNVLQVIPPHMIYSCKYWDYHLQNLTPELTMVTIMREFLFERFLFWLEVLSLVKAIPRSSVALSITTQWAQKDGNCDDIVQFTKDAQKFIRTFGGAIALSAPHVYISALPFSPKKSLVVQTYASQFKRLLDVSEGYMNDWPSLQLKLTLYEESVWSVCFSPGNGALIASGSRDCNLIIWDAETGEVIHILKGHSSSVSSVAFSPDGKRIASASWDSTICIWDVATGDLLSKFSEQFEGEYGPWIRSVAFSPDGLLLASGSDDHTIHLWDVETGDSVNFLSGHDGDVLCVKFSPRSGETIASCSTDKTVRIWDTSTGKMLMLLAGHGSKVESVAFSPNGKWIASSSGGGPGQHSERTIRIWDSISGEQLRILEGHSDTVRSVDFSSNGKYIASGSLDRTVRIWDAETGECIRTLSGHSDQCWAIAYSPDGARLAVGGYDGVVSLWDAESGDASAVLEGYSFEVESVSFSPNGLQIASVLKNTVHIWDSATGDVLHTFNQKPFSVRSVAYVSFLPDGICVASGMRDMSVCAWDASTGEIIRKFEHWQTDFCVAYSPDGTLFASRLWEIRNIFIQDVATGKELIAFEGHSDVVMAVTFSPDGKRLASAADDLTVRVWNIETGKVLHIFEGHTNDVRSVAFSPDGTRIASGSKDKTVRMWDVGTGKELRTFRGHTSLVGCVAFSPDGTRIVSGSRDGTIRVWDAVLNDYYSTPPPQLSDPIEERFFPLSFSHNPRHGTTGPDARVSDPDTPGDYRHLINVNNGTGWVTGPGNSMLLFWVPPLLRRGLYSPLTRLVIAETRTELDLRNFRHGPKWQECYTP